MSIPRSVVCALTLLVVACKAEDADPSDSGTDSALSGGDSDAASGADSGSGSDASTTARSDSGAQPSDGCVTVLDPTGCCDVVRAVELTELQADPCLVPWASSSGGGELGAECQPDPEECALVDCAPSEVFSRTAGRADDGTCQLTDECQAHDDCAVVPEGQGCACCQPVLPVSLLADGAPELSCEQPPSCAAVDCVQPLGDAPTCRLQNHGLRACQAGPATCEERETEAERWLQQHNGCTRDEDCTIVSNVPGCLGPFLCAAAISMHVDQDNFLRGAGELVDEYEEECRTCAIADCGDPSLARGVCQNNRCRVGF